MRHYREGPRLAPPHRGPRISAFAGLTNWNAQNQNAVLGRFAARNDGGAFDGLALALRRGVFVAGAAEFLSIASPVSNFHRAGL